ncbi:MAG: hypothetical protein JO102_03975 [Elusimicrobia bacterium]|nr:hypothetical protein [Elusimicrobiota bacterium]
MKRSRWMSLLALLTLLPLASVRADTSLVADGINKAIDAAQRLRSLHGYGLRSYGASVIGAFVPVNGTFVWNFGLEKKQYIIVGAGDSGVKQLTITSAKKDTPDKIIDEVKDAAPAVFLDIKDDNAVMKIRLTLNSADGASTEPHFVTFVALENGGLSGSLEQLRTMAGAAGSQSPAGWQLDPTDNVSVYGVLLQPGDDQHFYRTFFDKTEYTITGVPSSNASRLTLGVFERQEDTNDGAKIVEDSGNSPVIHVPARAQYKGNVHFKVDSTSDSAPAYALITVLTKR